jgi:hypothetical protein
MTNQWQVKPSKLLVAGSHPAGLANFPYTCRSAMWEAAGNR